MSDLREAKEALRQFNGKAARLDRTALRTWLESAGLGWTFRKVDEVWHVEWDELDEESTDAFLLTLRFFLQDRDGISFRRILAYYETLPVPEELRARVRQLGTGLNAYLDANSRLISVDRIYTHRAVLEMVLWGDRAHINPERRALVEPWLLNPGLRALLETEFAIILRELTKCILRQWAVNEEALRLLREPADDLGEQPG